MPVDCNVSFPVFEKMIRQDIMNFKEYIETKYRGATENTNDNPNILRSEAESVQDGSGNNNFNSPGGTGNY